jgi:hypothetical protein
MSKAPPVPPAGRTRQGGGNPKQDHDKSDLGVLEHRPTNRNHAEQGRQGNIRQNTRHQGYQQDR